MNDSKNDAAPSTSSTSENKKDLRKEIVGSMCATALRSGPDRKKEIDGSMDATALRSGPESMDATGLRSGPSMDATALRSGQIATLVTKIAELHTQISALETSRKALVEQKNALDDLEFDDKMKTFSGDDFMLNLHDMMRRAQKALMQSANSSVDYVLGPVTGRSWHDIADTRDDLEDFYEVAREYDLRLEMHEHSGGRYGQSRWSAMRRPRPTPRPTA